MGHALIIMSREIEEKFTIRLINDKKLTVRNENYDSYNDFDLIKNRVNLSNETRHEDDLRHLSSIGIVLEKPFAEATEKNVKSRWKVDHTGVITANYCHRVQT